MKCIPPTNLIDISCQAVLFDLDGTLIDSTARINRLWQWWTARQGIPYESVVEIMHGRPAAETLQMVAPHLQAAAEVEVLEQEEVTDMHDVHIIPGAIELLTRLDPARWAIVTSGSLRVARARIDHVGLPEPPILVTAEQTRRGKPAPDGYLLAAQRLGFAPGECVVVEDAPVGIEAGKAAGMRVIAITSTHPPASLARADAIAPDLQHLHVRAASSGLLVELSQTVISRPED